eukprot:COSAG04_NODE_4440_length_2090_cov_2.542441_1_plen_85_part_10
MLATKRRSEKVITLTSPKPVKPSSTSDSDRAVLGTISSADVKLVQLHRQARGSAIEKGMGGGGGPGSGAGPHDVGGHPEGVDAVL